MISARYVTFQMAKVAVSRQMFAEILSLIARLRAPSAPARGRGRANPRAARGEACRDAGKTVRIGVAVPSTAGFDRLLLAARQFAVARAGQKGDPGLKIARNLANVGLNRLAAAGILTAFGKRRPRNWL
jgi:hypothetical protein